MSTVLKVCVSFAAIGILAADVHLCHAASSPVPLEPNARQLIHISTRPRSAGSVFVDVRIEGSKPRVRDVQLKLSGIRLNVMRRTTTGEYQSIVSTGIDTWRKEGALHAYFAIDPELIQSSTLDLVLDAPGLPGENYHSVKLSEFLKPDRK
jgi:hypothetical protein